MMGKTVKLPAAAVDGRTVIVFGRVIKIASVAHEAFLEGNVVENPSEFIARLERVGLKADLLVFSQKVPDVEPKHDLYFEWDNVAVARTTDFGAWWDALPQESRKNVRRAQKRGVVVRTVALDDDLVKQVVEIYNESPMRQGKPFAHYGLDSATIAQDLSTFPETSEFIGAFVGTELVGFIKLIYMGRIASLMHIVSKNSHYDRRPTNALIAEAVALCARKGLTHLVYGNYTYGRKVNDSLAEFKRRNGFDKVMVPRYYVPLTVWGALVLALKLHKGLLDILPGGLISPLLKVRAWALRTRLGSRPKEQPPQQEAV